MKQKIINLIVLFTFLSLSLLLLIFWVIEVFGFAIPQVIPGFGLNTYGILILASYIIIFILQQKQQLKFNSATSVLELVFVSTVISLISQLLYFSIREIIILKDDHNGKIFIIFIVSLISTILLSIIATAIAFEIKKVKGFWKHIPTIALLLLLFILKDYIKDFKW